MWLCFAAETASSIGISRPHIVAELVALLLVIEKYDITASYTVSICQTIDAVSGAIR